MSQVPQQPNQPSEMALAAALTLLIASILGILDCLMFEPLGRDSAVVEWAFSKPSFVSSSLLVQQVLSFCCLASVFFLSQVILVTVVPERFRRAAILLSPVTSNGLIVLCVVALRMMRSGGQGARLAVFVVLCLIVLAALSSSLRRRIRRSPAERSAVRSSALAAALLMLTLTALFVLPDAYSLVKRMTLGSTEIRRSKSSILLIVMDTVRSDHMSCYGYDKPTTPRIDRIAAESLVFEQAYSAAPWTVPSHASMFTGLYPSEHGADLGHLLLDHSFTTLAEHLNAAGYQTAAFVENPFLIRSSGFSQGFAEYHELWRRPILIRAARRILSKTIGVRDTREYAGTTMPLLRRWIRDNGDSGKPFFAFVNLMAAHLPNYPRREYAQEATFEPAVLDRIEPVNLIPEKFYLDKYRLDERELDVMRVLYDQELMFLDAHIGETVDFLKNGSLLDQTVLILTSDHGENFGDHGLIEHQFCLYNTLIRVPLIIRLPLASERTRISGPLSTRMLYHWIVDEVATTKLDQNRTTTARTLTQAPEEIAIFAEHGNYVDMLRDLLLREDPSFDFSPFDSTWISTQKGNFKYIWSSRGSRELYDISSDPSESTNLIHRRQAEAAALLEEMQNWMESLPSRTGIEVGEPLPIDPESEDALRALGYIQ